MKRRTERKDANEKKKDCADDCNIELQMENKCILHPVKLFNKVSCEAILPMQNEDICIVVSFSSKIANNTRLQWA